MRLASFTPRSCCRNWTSGSVTPDYLADELLTRYEQEGEAADLSLAKQILDSDEPEVRSYPMLRYLFGAYEPLDEPLAVLATPGLVYARRRESIAKILQWDYYVTEAGRDAAERSLAVVPELKYYRRPYPARC